MLEVRNKKTEARRKKEELREGDYDGEDNRWEACC